MYTGQFKNIYSPFIILACILISSGCAQKAKVLQAGAAQFEAESLAAINKIDEIHVRELQATPLTQEQETDTFIKFMKGSSGSISSDKLNTMLHPLDLNLKNSNRKWQTFLQKLRLEYSLLTATFANLDKGSFFARDSVKKTAPYINKLTANMAAFAESIKGNPPKFLRRWAEITEELEWVRDNTNLSDDVKELRYKELRNKLIILETEEAQLEKEVIEQCLKAAKLGISLKDLVEKYDQLSMNDISEALAITFNIVGNFTGADLSALQANINDITNQIKDDPDLSLLFDTGLSEINDARTR